MGNAPLRDSSKGAFADSKSLSVKTMKKTTIRSARAGFSLVELLVVIVIIGLLATAVVTNYDKIFPQAKRTRVAQDLQSLDQAIQFFRLQNNSRLPENLDRLIQKDNDGIAYLRDATQVPRDPWNNEYVYQPHPNGLTYELMSYGSDNAAGGEGEAEDLSLASLKEKKEKK